MPGPIVENKKISWQPSTIFGGPNRQRSIKRWIGVIFLNTEMHNMSNAGIHFNKQFMDYTLELDNLLKLEYYNTRLKMIYIKEYGKSYIEKEKYEVLILRNSYYFYVQCQMDDYLYVLQMRRKNILFYIGYIGGILVYVILFFKYIFLFGQTTRDKTTQFYPINTKEEKEMYINSEKRFRRLYL